jgi:DNA polymerase phi
MTTTLSFFWHLSSNDKNIRLDASKNLISALEHFQAQHQPQPVEDDDEEESRDPLDTLNAQDVSYSIRRLVRGLASPRESSRLGFSVALTELLSRLDTVTCSQVLNLILDASKPQGSVTGQEERDLLFARLFGFTALIQSRLFVRTTPLSASASSSAVASTAESSSQVLTQLISLGEQKSWLRETAWWSILLALDVLADSDAAWKAEVMDEFVKTVFEEDKSWSPEKLAAGLKLRALRPNSNWKGVLAPTFKNPDILASVNLQTMAKILKESPTESEKESDFARRAPGSWKPQLHYVWDIILDQLLPQKTPSARTVQTSGSFQEFFRVVVDETFFSSTASLERKFLGFEIFRKTLPRVHADTMPMLFTQNFMRCWINHLASKDRQLHKAALQVSSEITSYVKENPAMGFTLLLQLTGPNGSSQFDKLTKTKTVESLLASMDVEGIKSYIRHLTQQFDDVQSDDTQTLNSSRMFIIDQLSALVRNTTVPRDDEWIIGVLEWLAVHGLFVVKKKSEKSPFAVVRDGAPKPALSDDLRQRARTALLTCLADLSSLTALVTIGDKATKVCAVASDGQFWISKVLNSIDRLEKDTKHVTLMEEVAEDDNKEQRTTVQDLCAKLREVSETQKSAAHGAEILLTAMVLQQMCSVETEEDVDGSLESCTDAAKSVFLAPSKKSKKSKKEKLAPTEADDSASPPPIDVFVDTIIGFLEKSTSSSFLRTVGKHAFALLSRLVQDSTVELILSQLERRDPSELVEDEDAHYMDIDDDAEDSEEEETESLDDDDEDAEDSNGEEENLELRRKIEEALRINGVDAATGDSDEESNEDLMDDEQMLAIDEHLVPVFKSQQKGGKDTNAQREATHFKNRVLDLVDVFLVREAQNPLTLRFVLPLADLVATTGGDERQLEDKATGLIRSRFGKAKEVPSEVDSEYASTVLKELHERARKAKTSNILSVFSVSSLYVSRVLVHNEQAELVSSAYRESLADFMKRKKSSLNTAFFQDCIKKHPLIGWALRSDILELAEEATNVYRRCQAFHLTQVLVTLIPALQPSDSELKKFMKQLSKSLSSLISRSCKDEFSPTSAQLKDLLKLALTSIRQTMRTLGSAEGESNSGAVTKIWDKTVWEDVSAQISASSRFQASTALKAMSNQICQTLEGKVGAASSSREAGKEKGTATEADVSSKPRSAKRKAEHVNGKEVPSAKKKVKAK